MSLINENGRRVISVSPKKNIEMVVYHNVDEKGRKASITRHEPLNPQKHVYRRDFSGKR